MTDFTDTIDVRKFLPSNYEQPDIAEALLRETPCRVSQLSDFLSLPINPDYKGDTSLLVKSIEFERLQKPVLLPGRIGDKQFEMPLSLVADEEIKRCDAADEFDDKPVADDSDASGEEAV
jgi:hypothetical protein